MKSFVTFLAVAGLSTQVLAVPAWPFEERGANVCSSGIYGELAPWLVKCNDAQKFCSQYFRTVSRP
jgi:hypothetical protein